MADLAKKKLERMARKAEKRNAKNARKANNNNQGQPCSSSSSNSTPPDDNEDNVFSLDELFSKFQEDGFDRTMGLVLDGFLRDTIRRTAGLHVPRFGSLPLLLGKNLVYIQLVVLDIDGSIQGKLHMTGIKVEPHAVDLIPCSRNLFQESVPYLLKDNAHWFFSRSLVFKGYNGVIDEAVKFPAHDPVGGLPDLPFLPSACIRWAEVFLFVAGDFNVKEEGLDSRDAVKELLHELNSKEGISKLLAFDVVASSVVGGKEKLEEVH